MNASLTNLALPSMDLNKLRSEARARIHWGETREEVCAFLQEKGIPPVAADVIVAEFVGEQHGDARLRGLVDFVGGALGALVCGGIVYAFCAGGVPVLPVKICALLAVGAVVGVCVPLNGLVRLLFGARGERSLE